MDPRVVDRVLTLVGARRALRVEHVQSLWSGYGEIARVAIEGASVIVKHVSPPRATGASHERKLRSYDVERAWYLHHASHSKARVPRCLAAERDEHGWLFVLEDLDAAGFPHRRRTLSDDEIDACLVWLATFHGSFLDHDARGLCRSGPQSGPDAIERLASAAPPVRGLDARSRPGPPRRALLSSIASARLAGHSGRDLWPQGTYWHLSTRQDELDAMPRGPLRDAARAIDAKLDACAHRTLVHGDAKTANFCFGPSGVAAVDFQYVGAGCGMKDVVYFFSCLGASRCERDAERWLDTYFAALAAPAVEAEWRTLVPFAWADLERFYAGWSPGHYDRFGDAMTRRALAQLA